MGPAHYLVHYSMYPKYLFYLSHLPYIGSEVHYVKCGLSVYMFYLFTCLSVSDSELVIFLADVKAPYFKPKVHVKKDVFPR